MASSHKHTYAKKLLDRYQNIYCPRGLLTERNFLNFRPFRYGPPGSARVDVLDTINNIAYDYKFVLHPPGLKQWQMDEIKNNVPGIEVLEVNP